WRDPAAAGEDSFQDRQLDLDQLAFRPAPDKKAPPRAPNRRPEARPWWEAFWKPMPPRPIDQDEATLHLFHAESLRLSAPLRHMHAWESSQFAALAGAAGGWAGPGALPDAGLRLALLWPRMPEPGARYDTLPPADQFGFTMQRLFTRERDDTP